MCGSHYLRGSNLAFTVAQESAAKWLKSIHRGPKFNNTFGPYMASLPQPSELLTSELFTDDLIRLLQCPKLVSS